MTLQEEIYRIRRVMSLNEQGPMGFPSANPMGDSWKMTSGLDKHTQLLIIGIGAAFIPYVGLYVSSGIGLVDAAIYYKEGDKTSAGIVTFFSSLPLVGQIPGVKELGKKGLELLAKKFIQKSSPIVLTPTEKEVVEYVVKNEKEVVNEVKNKLNLQRTKPSQAKPKWDYQKTKISDELTLVNNPRGRGQIGSIFKEVIDNLTNERISLKIGKDMYGVYYYMSAKMSNPVRAGKAFLTLIKQIPTGSRFRETIRGSLSTDSFYLILRRVKDFTPKVNGYIKLNSSGVNRFQKFIKNTIPSEYADSGLQFATVNDAKPLLDALNQEISKVGIKTPARIVKSEYDGYVIELPNIELIVR